MTEHGLTFGEVVHVDIQALEDELAKMTAAMDQMNAAATEAERAFRLLGNEMDRWKREFESTLTHREMVRYLRLCDEAPELGWLDVAVIIENERRHS